MADILNQEANNGPLIVGRYCVSRFVDLQSFHRHGKVSSRLRDSTAPAGASAFDGYFQL